MGYLAKQILKSMGLDFRKREKRERILKPNKAFLEKYTNAYKSMAEGETLDERMSSLLSYSFIKRVLHASYSDMVMTGAFAKKYPLTAVKLKEVFCKKS